MSVLNVTGLRKLLGADEILRQVDLRVENGEKVGCVGRNGAGKSTLLRLLTGELVPDAGKVQLTRGARMGHVEQRPRFEPGTSVRAWVEAGLAEVHEVERELERVHEELAAAQGDALQALLRRQDELGARMEQLDGWHAARRVETVLSGIGLDPSLWERDATTLSGGEKSRTAMARELVSLPDLLLLDEPTNHLDLAGIEWLEAYLKEIPSAVFLVSHDRRLLDRLVGTIVEIERGVLTRWPGNYSKYLTLKEERYRFALRAWEQQQDLVRKEEGFIKKHMGSQRTAEAKGRQKKLESLERLERPWHDVRRPVIRMRTVERGGEVVLETRGLAVGHDRPLVSGVDLRIGRGERVGLIGPNGAGKTTLLRVLAGRARPLAGTVEHGHKAQAGYYDQETAGLLEEGTPFLEMRRLHPEWTDEEVRSHLARFLFRGDAVEQAIAGLSGGERARLALAKLVLSEPSWLALDEPTNHLDLASRTALEEMLDAFSGAIVVITHDRELLDGLVTRILSVEDGGLASFPGNYSAWRAAREAQALERAQQAAEAERRRRQAAARAPATPPAAEPGSRKGPRNPWRFQKLEEEIIALEEEKGRLLASLADEALYRQPERLKEAQTRLAELERDLDEKNIEWEGMI